MNPEIRKEIRDFVAQMEKVMQDHDAVKGDSWKGMNVDALQNLLLNEVFEAQKTKAPAKEWVNVANFCMMAFTIKRSLEN